MYVTAETFFKRINFSAGYDFSEFLLDSDYFVIMISLLAGKGSACHNQCSLSCNSRPIYTFMF